MRTGQTDPVSRASINVDFIPLSKKLFLLKKNIYLAALYVLLTLFSSSNLYAGTLLCRLTLKAMLRTTTENSNEVTSRKGEYDVVDQFRFIINQSARQGTNDFFKPFGRSLEYSGPTLDSNIAINPPVLTLIDQNPQWSLDPDILKVIHERLAEFGPKQFSPLRFEEARILSMERLYQSYAYLGPEIRNHIEAYRLQDSGTFATHLVFALPMSPEAKRQFSPKNEFDQHFPPTHEFIGRAQGIGSYSPKNLLNIEKDFEAKLQLDRKEGELWVELGRAMMETKSELSPHAQAMVNDGGGWPSLQRSVFLKQILWLNFDVQPHALVIHANAGMTRYLQRLTRLIKPLRVIASTKDFGSTENAIVLTKQDLLTIQRVLVLEDMIDSIQRTIAFIKTNPQYKNSNLTSTISASENAAFKDLGLNYFFEDPNSFWKVTFARTLFGSDYWDIKGAAQYKVSSSDLKLFLSFLKNRQKALFSSDQLIN